MPMPTPDADLPADDDPPPPDPVAPDLDACCGNGCNPCIFDLFDAERERHRQVLREWQQRQAGRRPEPGQR